LADENEYLKMINRQHDHVVINLKQEISNNKKSFEDKLNQLEFENETLTRQVSEYKHRIDCVHDDLEKVLKKTFGPRNQFNYIINFLIMF
jgi:hypothetical protein